MVVPVHHSWQDPPEDGPRTVRHSRILFRTGANSAVRITVPTDGIAWQHAPFGHTDKLHPDLT